jgi:hypothetical protein
MLVAEMLRGMQEAVSMNIAQPLPRKRNSLSYRVTNFEQPTIITSKPENW